MARVVLIVLISLRRANNFSYSVIYSLGKMDPTKMCLLSACGFIAQLVDPDRTSIAEVTGSNPVKTLNVLGFFIPICINC